MMAGFVMQACVVLAFQPAGPALRFAAGLAVARTMLPGTARRGVAQMRLTGRVLSVDVALVATCISPVMRQVPAAFRMPRARRDARAARPAPEE